MNETLARKSCLGELTNGFATLLAQGMEQAFGPGVNRPVLGPLTWADLAAALGLVLLLLVAHCLAAAFLRRKTESAEASDTEDPSWRQFFHAFGGPLYTLLWVGGVYMAATTLLRRLMPLKNVRRRLSS